MPADFLRRNAVGEVGIFDDSMKLDCLNHGCVGPTFSTQDIFISLFVFNSLVKSTVGPKIGLNSL